MKKNNVKDKENNTYFQDEKAPLIKVRNLSFAYEKTPVLKNVNLEVPPGIILGIVGPNGGGKTTLLKIMLGLLKGYTGEVKVRCHYGPGIKALHHKCIGYVPQRSDLNRKFPATVNDVVEMGLYGLTGAGGLSTDEKEYVSWLIGEVGVKDIKDKSINEISGGQLQRALIARALVTKPSLLFMDEPLVGVDQSGVMKFIELLLMLKERLELTVILVTHDFHSVSLCADKLACLNRTIHFHDNPSHLTAEKLSRVYSCGFDAFRGVEGIMHGTDGQANA